MKSKRYHHGALALFGAAVLSLFGSAFAAAQTPGDEPPPPAGPEKPTPSTEAPPQRPPAATPPAATPPASGPADLRVSFSNASGDNDVEEDENVTYIIDVQNKGPGAAQNVQLLTGFDKDFKVAEVPQIPCGTVGSSNMRCALGTLAAGANAIFYVTSEWQQQGHSRDSVEVSSTTADSDYTSNQAHLETDVDP
jgi:hypothetical protein